MTDKEATKNLKGQIKCLKCETGIDCEKCRPNWSKEKDIEALDMAIDILENQKTGHWIRITNGAMKEKYICSECGRQIEDYGVENLLPIKYPYCHCGVKMEGNKE